MQLTRDWRVEEEYMLQLVCCVCPSEMYEKIHESVKDVGVDQSTRRRSRSPQG